MWAGGERPELLYAVKELCRHFGDAMQSDLAAAKRMARYLLGTFKKTLQLEVDDAFTLPEASRQLAVQAVSDATWASTTDCRSTSGGTLWAEGFLLHAWSKTQPTVSQSSCEAELLAANLCAREGLFVATILEEIGLRSELHVFTDSASALKVTARRGAGRMRHLRVKELWLQEAVRERRLKVFYVPGQSNVADVLIKALPRERFEHLAEVLGMRGPGHTTHQRECQSGKQWISAVEPSDSITVIQDDDDQQYPSTLTPKLPLGLSFKNFVQLIVCITVLMTWLMYRLGQMLCGRCCPKRAPLKRSVATQSQTTYTAVAKDHHPRFRVLGQESGGAWRD